MKAQYSITQKLTIVIAGFLMVLILGGLTACSSAPSQVGGNSHADDKSMAAIEFDDAVILDNDVVTVTVERFYEEEANWSGSNEPVMEKCINLKVHNKLDTDILFKMQQGYVGDESVTIINAGNSDKIAAGKTNAFDYRIEKDEGGKQHISLDSLEDLYDFDCEVQTYKYKKGTDDLQTDGDEITKISFNELLK